MSLRDLFRPASRLLMEAFGVSDQAALRREIVQLVRAEVAKAADDILAEGPAAPSLVIPEGSVWKDLLVDEFRANWTEEPNVRAVSVLQWVPGTRLMRYGVRFEGGLWYGQPTIIVAPGA